MVGLKTFWLTLFTMLFLGACVPQTKQSKCATDEAFNAQLRTCVPVVPGPTEFIKIINPSPSSTLSRFVNDLSQPIDFVVDISNPYGLDYCITWDRLYNGVTYSIAQPNCKTKTYSPLPAAMTSGVQTGIHVISVKLKDANNNIVDTHNFEVVMGNVPTPYINTFLPTNNVVNLTPVSPDQPFSVSIKNNSAITTGYRTFWTVHNANNIHQAAYDFDQAFASTVNTATHSSNYVLFDPSALGIGNYTVRAKLVNTATSEIADEQQWLVSVAHPPFSKIVSRNLIEGRTSPAYNTVTNAYSGVSYNVANTYNFMPVSTTVPALATEQSDFCVTVADGEGAYTGGAGVRVNWYLDGQTLVSTRATTALDATVCLADEPALANIVFNNVNPYDSTTHTITARVFDITAGGVEYTYTTADMDPAVQGPISWSLNVKPQNDKPLVAFGPMTGLTNCVANALGSTYSGCKVVSDTDFSVSLNLTGDDFHFTTFDESKFNYDFVLYRNNVAVGSSECIKLLPGDADVPFNAPTGDADGPNYQCHFNLRSWDSTGPIAVTTGTWQIVATLNDTGSPITPAVGAISRSMTWNITATEKETAPTGVITHGGAIVDENTPLILNLTVTDGERDNFKYDILYCKDDAAADPTCTNTGSLIGLTPVTRSASTNPLVVPVSKVLDEDFLLKLPLVPCDNLARDATCVVRFKAYVEDIPLTVAGLPNSNVSIINVTVRNKNPPPVFNDTLALPSPAAYTALPAYALVGNPVSFAAGAAGVITDSSTAILEGLGSHRYQWYVQATTNVLTDTRIEDAVGVNLVWTPSLMREANLATTENPLKIFLCIEDQASTIITYPSVTAGSECNNANPWTVRVRDNVVTMQDMTVSPGFGLATNGTTDIGNEVAVWYSTPGALSGVTSSAVYMAMVANDGRIHVKKGLLDNTGNFIKDSATTLVSFNALSGGATADNIQNLSMTGTDNSLYIAYVAASSLSPLANFPQVRRIDISSGKVDNYGAGDTLVGYDRKFGFDYDGIDIDLTLCSSGCTMSNPLPAARTGTPPTITFAPAATVTGSITITTEKGAEVIPFAVGNVPDTICGNCTAADMATSLATTINRNQGNLAGLSATAAAGVVTIVGSTAKDFIDGSQSAVFNQVTSQMGDIFIAGGRWHVPLINASLPGIRSDKISIIHGAVDQHISLASGAAVASPVAGNGLDILPTSSRMSAYFNGSNIIIGVVSKVGGVAGIHSFDLTFAHVASVLKPFDTKVLSDIQLTASANYVFAIIKTTANIMHQGVYSPALAITREFVLDATTLDGPTLGIINYADLSSYKLVPNGNEAYLLASSRGASASTYQIYLSRIYNDGTNWVLTCKDCDYVSFQGFEASGFVNVAVAPIRIKPAAINPLYPNYRTSTDGSDVGQGVRNQLFIGYGQYDASVPVTNPMIGVMNIEAEQIGAQSVHAGTALNVDSGFFRPPFIKN